MNNRSDAERIQKNEDREGVSNREESWVQAGDEDGGSGIITLVLFWSFVGIPLMWGVVQTFKTAMKLFE